MDKKNRSVFGREKKKKKVATLTAFKQQQTDCEFIQVY